MDLHPNTATNDFDSVPAPAHGVEPGQTCWNAMLGEAHKVILVTLEELALLAGLATAATEVPGLAATDASDRSNDAPLSDAGPLSFRT